MNANQPSIDVDFLRTLSVLYVEDEDAVREELAHYLRRRCPKLAVARNGQEGLELFKANRYDVVVTDVKMPVMDGLDMARSIKSIQEEVPVIIVTAYNEVDYFLRAIEVGVDRYVKKPINPSELIQAIYKSTVVRFQVRELEKKRLSAFVSVQEALTEMAHAIDKRNPFTDGHQHRVSQLASAIAEDMQLQPDEIEGIRLAGAIHDVGFLYVSLQLLCAPRQLSPEEFELIKPHAEAGGAILGDTHFPWPIVEVIRQHHERLDGSGYPQGLKGEDIRLEARIVAVADVVEAMVADRPQRRALGIEAALEELRRNAGKLYDPSVVASCERVMQRTKLEFWGA